MSRRGRKYGRGPLTPCREGFAALSVSELAALIASIAVLVEGCGSIQRAVEVGVIGGDYVDGNVIAPQVLGLIPSSRGGTRDGSDVERDWVRRVREAERAAMSRGLEDVEGVRLFVEAMERSNGGAL